MESLLSKVSENFYTVLVFTLVFIWVIVVSKQLQFNIKLVLISSYQLIAFYFLAYIDTFTLETFKMHQNLPMLNYINVSVCILAI